VSLSYHVLIDYAIGGVIMGNIGPWELALVLLIAVIFFGPSKLPDIAKGLGKAVNEFKQASTGAQQQFKDAIKPEVPPTPVATVTQEEVQQKPVNQE
jgi:sec-independent protein translocase protein TatA